MVTAITTPVKFRITLRKGEIGYWIVECPGLPGCVSQGKTKKEAIANIQEAIAGWLESAQAHPETWGTNYR